MPNRAFVWLWILLTLSVGCVSTNVPRHLERINTMLDEAENASSREYATYYFHRAIVFRDRARVELSHAHYDVAAQYLDIVEASLNEAMDVTEQRKELERRRNQRQDGSPAGTPSVDSVSGQATP